LAFRAKLSQILTIKESPHRIALAFGMGIFIGMSPLLGLHTVLGLALAWLLRLNKMVTLIGVFVTNPWTIIPIYSFGTWVGARLTGMKEIIPHIDWGRVTFDILLNELGHLLVPFVLGTFLIGAVSAVIGYALIYHAVRKSRG